MSGAQTSSFYPVNQLLADNATQIQNYYAPQRNQLLIQEAQQRVGANEIEYAARAAAGLLDLKDEAAMSAAYPGVVQDAQRYGFLKNAPSEFPGKARLQQIAAMGISAKDQYEQQGVAGDYNAWVARQNAARGGGGTGGTTAAPAAPAGGGGFTGDREQDRALIVKQESGGDPTALNYVARNDPSAYARGATASGKYQFVNSTWREGMQLAGLDPAQYPTAREAPEAVQDKVFDAVYAKYGSKPWQKGPQDWVRDEQGNYQLVTVRPPAGSPGGAPAGTPQPPPAPYQTASLTPTPPPTGATPAAPSQPAATSTAQGTTPAQPAPAATTAAAVPPPKPRLANGLTAEQNQTIDGLMAIRPRNRAEFDALQQKVATARQAFLDHNDTEDRQYQADLRSARTEERQTATAAQTAANEAERLQIARQAEQRAQAKAEQEAKAAGRPVQGNDVDAQHESTILELADKMRRGETLTKAEQDQYDGAYYALQQRGGQTGTMSGPGGSTIPFQTTRKLPPAWPAPSGGALPAIITQPDAAKQEQMTAEQSKAAGFADRIRDALPIITDTSPAAMSRWQKLLGLAPLGNSMVSEDFQQHMQSERNFINAVLRRESGAAISEPEFVNARQQYIPQPGDGPKVLAEKARNRESVLASLVREAGPTYKPAAAPSTSAPTKVIRYDANGNRVE